MHYDLGKKIDDYTEELFSELGVATLTEDGKADLFARVQDHLHKTIINILKPLVNDDELRKIKRAVGEENYQALGEVLGDIGQDKEILEKQIDDEFQKLKLTIASEQKNA